MIKMVLVGLVAAMAAAAGADELGTPIFGGWKAPGRPAPVRIAKLPAGVKPTVKLDEWTGT